MMIGPNGARWLGGICIGVVIAETFKAGVGAIILLACGLFGRWLLGKLAGTVFDDELAALKKRFALKDPAKQAAWAHGMEKHTGSFRDCRLPICNLFGITAKE